MSFTDYVIGALLIAFFVFITSKGELPKYLALFRGETANNQGVVQLSGTGVNPSTQSAVQSVVGPAVQATLANGFTSNWTGDNANTQTPNIGQNIAWNNPDNQSPDIGQNITWNNPDNNVTVITSPNYIGQ